MYMRCPLPDFCPLMDRNFAAVQKTIKSTSDLADVRLVSVSFDPEFDTPAVAQDARGDARGGSRASGSSSPPTPEEIDKLTQALWRARRT